MPWVSEVEGVLHIWGVRHSAEVSEWDEMEGECDCGAGVAEGWGEMEEGKEGCG